ncbi:MAG TPA: class I SAM-dependent methyltransferase [Acidimicrobiales bacterium]|nr:class I SAM-dependent methyltransferase [Acidimicrobiales bacterium]
MSGDASSPPPLLWEYYERRVAQGVPGIANAVAYWTGLGVDTSAHEIAVEAEQVERALRGLPPASFVEIGAGPGTFTYMLPGRGIALDQSESALRALVNANPSMPVVRADALQVPLRDRAVERAFAAHIYGLLDAGTAGALISEARRVANQVVVLDAGCPEGVPAEHWQDRTLPDGSEWRIFRRHFSPGVLAEELGGSVIFGGQFYVLIAA